MMHKKKNPIVNDDQQSNDSKSNESNDFENLIESNPIVNDDQQSNDSKSNESNDFENLIESNEPQSNEDGRPSVCVLPDSE